MNGFKRLMTYTHSKSAMEGMSMALARQRERVTEAGHRRRGAPPEVNFNLRHSALLGATKLKHPVNTKVPLGSGVGRPKITSDS
jgi:hypothetical protein